MNKQTAPSPVRAAHRKMIESKMGWNRGCMRTYIKWNYARRGMRWNGCDKACLNDERTRKGSRPIKKETFVLLMPESHPLRISLNPRRNEFQDGKRCYVVLI